MNKILTIIKVTVGDNCVIVKHINCEIQVLLHKLHSAKYYSAKLPINMLN